MRQKHAFRTRKGDGGFNPTRVPAGKGDSGFSYGSASTRKGDSCFNPTQAQSRKGDSGFRQAGRLVGRA